MKNECDGALLLVFETFQAQPCRFYNRAVPQTLVIPQPVSPSASHTWDAPAPLRFWHLASFDAPTVAATWSLAFAKAAGVCLPAWVPMLLALATWVVYIGDRLLDARSALRARRTHRLRQRHLFHWRHRRAFLLLSIAAICTGAWIVLSFMPTVARVPNSLLAIPAMLYFFCVHAQGKRHSHLPKELLVGVLFTAACAAPAFGRAAGISAAFIATILLFVALAWLNCYAIELWESAEQTPSRSRIFFISCVLALGGMFGATVFHATHFRVAILLAAGTASAVLLAFLDCTRNRLTPLALRVTADLVLLTPLVGILR